MMKNDERLQILIKDDVKTDKKKALISFAVSF